MNLPPEPAPTAVQKRPVRPWLEGGLAVVDQRGRLLQANEPFWNWLALEEHPPLPAPIESHLGIHNPAWVAAIIGALESGAESGRLQLPGGADEQDRWLRICWLRRNGEWLLHCDAVPSPQPEAPVETVNGSGSPDPRQHWQTELQLRRTEAQLQNLLERWPGVVFSQRPDLSFSSVSPMVETLTGIAPEDWTRSSSFWETIHEGDREELERQLRQCAATGQSTTTLRIRNLTTGRIAYVLEQRKAILSGTGLVLGYEGFWVDVTRQTIAEKCMTSGAWKETLAVLTMGLAHDFGNILAGIHSLSETLEDVVATAAPDHRGSVNLIRRNAMLASQIVRRIVTLHQGRLGEFGYHSLNSLMADSEELVRKIVPRRIQVESDYSKQDLPAYMDAVEFRQVIVNLVLNAAEAVTQVGKIRLITARHPTAPVVENCQGTLPPAPLLEVTVADTGTGIPARYLRSIFEPFFTTKSLSKGTGLGLYNARLFVERHKGAISVESKEGAGTAFHLWLPEATFQEAERHLTHDQAVRRTLLLLDLPGRSRDATAGFLRHNGYLVVVEEPDRALAQLHSGDYRIAAIVLLATGQQMPSVEMVRKLRRNAPESRLVLLVAGRNQDELPMPLIETVDLMLPQGLSESEILGKISTLFT